MRKQMITYFILFFIFNVYANDGSNQPINIVLNKSTLYHDEQKIVNDINSECSHGDDCYYIYELKIDNKIIKKIINPLYITYSNSGKQYFNELFAINTNKVQNKHVLTAMNTISSSYYEIRINQFNNIHLFDELITDRDFINDGIRLCRVKSTEDTIVKLIDFREPDSLDKLTKCTTVGYDTNSENVYQVVSKSYFYDKPNLDSKTNLYLIKGDYVTFSQRENDFYKVTYTTSKNKVIKKWLQCSAINAC